MKSMKKESKPVPLSPVEETKIWEDMLNYYHGEYILNVTNTQEDVIKELMKQYNLTRKR